MITTSAIPSGVGAVQTLTDRRALGRDEFLKLLVTQLKNQDPESPLRPDEFAAQLAQFTTVEQLTKLNDAFTAQAASSQVAQLMNQTTLSVSLIGRQVTARGDQVVVSGGGPSAVPITVGGTGGRGTLTVFDPSGREVGQRDLGSLAPGQHLAKLPSLPDGQYTYRVTVMDANGASSPVLTHTIGTVDGVAFKNGTLVLRIGGAEIPLDQLVEVKPAS